MVLENRFQSNLHTHLTVIVIGVLNVRGPSEIDRAYLMHQPS